MTDEEQIKLWGIRSRKKSGERVTDEENTFCKQMFEKDPETYQEMSRYLKRFKRDDDR